MGDGLTDTIREAQRCECFVRYIKEIHSFLLDRTEPNRSAVRKAAEATGRAYRRYSGQDTDSATCDALLDGLTSGDETTWLQLLEWSSDTRLYDAFLSMSPFRNSILLFGRSVQYGRGVEMDMRQLQRFITDVAKSQDGLEGRFCVSLPIPEPGTTRILKKK